VAPNANRDKRLSDESGAPIRDATSPRVATKLRVTLAHQAKGVLVKAHPQMKAVLLDSICGTAAGSALAAKPPAYLINRDVIFPTMLWTTELKGRGNRRASAAQDSDFDGLVWSRSAFHR